MNEKSKAFRHTPFEENLVFLKRWFRNPLRLGALFPSSQALSMTMAKTVVLKQQRDRDQYVVEIGAGTGRFTEALLNMGFPPQKLVCIEIDKDLYHYMKKRFPHINLFWGNACHLENIVPQSIHQKISCIVSGIPMVSIPDPVRRKIVQSCFKIMSPEGRLYQFTYSPFAPITDKGIRLRGQRIHWVFWNMPPASIWSYRQC